ncbi:MAG: IclR family transcriptional regulator [Acidimicrobiia bacterium]|nr:IclR family transcriptional regulator [Acidimicrobiia bacterium]
MGVDDRPPEVTESALEKGMRVLEALVRADGPVRLSHLAAELDLQKSLVHRVLRSFVDRGYVAKDPATDLYVATLKVWELGQAVVGTLPIKQAATTVLQELHRRTGETVSLSILDGDDVLYLDKIISPRPMGFTTRVGSRLPAPLTVGGRAMLAYEDDPKAVITRVAERLGPKVIDVDKALDDVRRSRDDGYLVGTGRTERGIVGIAAAIPGPGGRAAAGLTVSAPAKRLDGDREHAIIDALLIAAAGLADAIGHR